MSIRQRLYPDGDQTAGMLEHCHQTRFVYNIGLEQRSMWRRDKHSRGTHPEFGELNAPPLTVSAQMRELSRLRHELEWLRAGSSSVQQGALRDLDRAFRNFFAGRAGYPAFKRRSDRRGSFVVRDVRVRRLSRHWASVAVPKVGEVRFRISRSWADIRAGSSARVTLRNGRWHVSFTTSAPEKFVVGSGPMLGVDLGIANTVATSDGRFLQAPSLTAAERARFARLEERLSRQRMDSNRRRQTLHELEVLRRRLSDRRGDWVEQTTTRLARSHAVIAVEDLRVRRMVRRPKARPDPDAPGAYLRNGARSKSSLNRSILASCWGSLLTRLEQKLPTDSLVRVDPRSTSRTCAECGHSAPGNRESQAIFRCKACGHAAHADTNAATVILDRALTTQAAGHAVSGRGSPARAGSVNQRVA